jgi:glycosyltransferase involved in cell wall biosynthesis
MKTILIAHNFTENSFASMSFNLAHYLAELGNRVIFISHRPFFKDMKIIKKGNGEIIVLSWSSEKRPTSFKDFFWFAKIYLQYKPKVIIGHFVGSNITISLSKLLSFGSVKTIAYYHTLTNQILTDSKKSSIKMRFLFFRKKMFYKMFCDVIVCPSKLAKIDLESFFLLSKGIVVLNPMSDRFKNKKCNSKENIVVSYLGRLEASKGVIDLIHAFDIFKEKNKKTNIIVNIAGSGSQENEIKELINNNKSIKYYGGLPYSEIDEYLRKSHFAIIPSKFDALNMVGIESMMNFTPLLISNSTGLSDYLIDGKECYKFDSNTDSIVSLFEKVEKNIDKQKQMSEDARSTFLNIFSMDNYCNEFSKIIL